MTYRIRHWLFRFFVLLFIVLTTYTSLYATGYQINWRGEWRLDRLLVKTGTLALNTQPTGAKIYINDRLQSIFSWRKFSDNNLTTPAKIKNLAPGEYDLRLEKDGYWPWEKKLNILAEQTTYAEDINLFKKDSILNILACNCQEISLSPNRRYLLLKQGQKIIDLKTSKETPLSLDRPIGQVEWLGNNNQILIDYRLFNLSDFTSLDYAKIIGPDISQLFYREADGRLYYEYKNSLNYYDANQKTSTKILSGSNYLSYSFKGDYLFFLSSQDKKIILSSYSLNDQSVKNIEIPYPGDYKFLDNDFNWLTLYDQKSKSLYLIDPLSLKLVREGIKNFRGGLWLANDKLLYYTDFEIYLFDLKQNNKILINRVGESISDLVWQAKNNYIIYATKTSLNTLDLATDTITPILKADNISSIFLDSKTSTLYFTAKVNNQSGLYKMIVQ